jgi:type II secretory ATPase GspE/PulE/Tfp pilus assembly ATPase PilB-like protein
MGIEPFLVGASVTASIAQRLVRSNCTACGKKYDPDPQVLERLGLPLDGEYSRGAGCDKCAQTGYRGRLGVYEVMIMTPTMSHMITEGRPGSELYAEALRQGMQPLVEDAKAKVLAGLTTVEEVLRVVSVEAR